MWTGKTDHPCCAYRRAIFKRRSGPVNTWPFVSTVAGCTALTLAYLLSLGAFKVSQRFCLLVTCPDPVRSEQDPEYPLHRPAPALVPSACGSGVLTVRVHVRYIPPLVHQTLL